VKSLRFSGGAPRTEQTKDEKSNSTGREGSEQKRNWKGNGDSTVKERSLGGAIPIFRGGGGGGGGGVKGKAGGAGERDLEGVP